MKIIRENILLVFLLLFIGSVSIATAQANSLMNLQERFVEEVEHKSIDEYGLGKLSASGSDNNGFCDSVPAFTSVTHDTTVIKVSRNTSKAFCFMKLIAFSSKRPL